ncbi:MAG: helix-turn-helix domain-containing protein [Sciscionella sp.]
MVSHPTVIKETTARKRELGEQLRNHRERAGLRAADIAYRLGSSASKVSRMESGARGTSEIDVAMYLTVCGVTRTQLDELLDLCHDNGDGYWLRPHGTQLPDELRSLVFQETTAMAISSFELVRIPGLLQTEDYARAMIAHSVAVPTDGIEPRVRARMDRGSLLHRTWPPQSLFLIHEQALRLRVGPWSIMHEQLLHLVFATSRQQCVIRVVPSSAGAHA